MEGITVQYKIACVMLTANRHDMAARAIRCFKAQDYENKRLVIYDTGREKISLEPDESILHVWNGSSLLPLCELMNKITEVALREFAPDLIAKLDDDDFSAPQRLTHQSRTLFQSGREVVGFNDMPFLMPDRSVRMYRNPADTYAVGTSLMYTPKAWKASPFPDTSADPVKRGRAADTGFVHHHASRGRLLGVSSLSLSGPLMVATIHQGNTTAKLEACVPLAEPGFAAHVLRLMDQA